jgi:hypothetical protein
MVARGDVKKQISNEPPANSLVVNLSLAADAVRGGARLHHDRGTSDTEIKQTVFMADVGGELFDAWAGPLLGTSVSNGVKSSSIASSMPEGE